MSPRARTARLRSHADEGSISLLTLGWVLIAVVALLVMAAATQLHVDRMRLASLADELALAAADEVDAADYYSATADPVALDEGLMKEAATAWLAADPRPWAGEVMVADVSASPDGTAAVTVVRRVWPLFDAGALAAFGDGILLTAEGRARAG